MKQGLAGYLILYCQLCRCQWSAAAGLRLKQRRPLCRNTAPVLVAQLNGHNDKILQEMFLAKVGVTRDPTRPADVHLS